MQSGGILNSEALTGCLLGTAVGDALGLAYEGLPPGRASRMLGPADRYRFVLGRGMVSDDTEHAILTLQALMDCGGDEARLATSLARRLRHWFVRLPAGVGLATARACIKLCLGFGPHRSGVWSAGNGPAMRAPILGAAIDDLDLLTEFNRIASRITHTDPRAEQGALAVALAAWMARREQTPTPEMFFGLVKQRLAAEPALDLLTELDKVASSLENRESTRDFAARLYGPKGVSGYVLQTVPVVLHCWLSHPRNYRAGVKEIISCGGDADSTAAILGGLIGTAVGSKGIPEEWIDGLVEWPATVDWMNQLATSASSSSTTPPPPELRFWKVLPRNLFFLGVIVPHTLRRLLPPY